jgi:DNA polymerase III delta prime subunit
MLPRLEHIIEEERLTVDEGGKRALFILSKGDMRRMINILQVLPY